jgi:hypothetical protein
VGGKNPGQEKNSNPDKTNKQKIPKNSIKQWSIVVTEGLGTESLDG